MPRVERQTRVIAIHPTGTYVPSIQYHSIVLQVPVRARVVAKTTRRSPVAYCRQATQQKDNQRSTFTMTPKFVPSPYSLSLTALISLHCEQLEASPLYSDLEDPSKSHEAVQLFLQSVLHHAGIFSEASQTVKSFLIALEDAAGSKIAEKVLDWLRVGGSSIDSVVDLMNLAQNATRPSGYIDPSSLTGTFVRNVSLGFEDLSFERVARLWKSFKAQVEEASVSPRLNEAKPSEWLQHADQVESGLRHVLQNSGSVESIVGSLVDKTFGALSSNDLSLPSLHLLRFLNSSHHGERVESIEQLHAYFDRALIRSKEADGMKSHLMQFAPIVLSAVHCRSGNSELAALATEEAARVAQHSQDTACVAFALGWLYENNLSSGQVGDVSILNRCSSRAAEGDRHNLLTGAKFLLVREALRAKTKILKSTNQIWSHLSDAIAELPSSETSSIYDRPTRTTNIPNAKVCLDALARQRIIASSVWESLGQNSIAALSSLVSLQCHPSLSSEDARSAIQNVSRHPLFGSQNIRTLEMKSARRGERDSSTKPFPISVYGRSLSSNLDLVDMIGLSEEVGRQIHLILHEWAIRRGDFQDALGLMRLMLSNVKPSEKKAMIPLRQMIMQQAVMYSQTGDFEKARTLLRKLLASCKETGSAADEGQFLLQRAILLVQSTKEYSVNAIAPLLVCLSFCETVQLDGTKGPALALLAQLLLGMSEAELAISTLKAALPLLLQNDHVWFQGHAFMTMAKSYLRLAKEPGSSKPNSKRKIKLALKYLVRSESILLGCHDARGLQEIYYIQARLHAAPGGDEALKKKAADNFVAVSRHLSTGYIRVDAIRGTQSRDRLKELATRSFPVHA